ncbi:MAG: hypothetical protein V4591_09690 [Bdellovibrionota bacterium]
MLVQVFFRNFILFIILFLSQNAYSTEGSQEPSLNCHLIEAQKIISNLLPGEEDRAEKILINCIRINPNNLDSILELAGFIERQVSTGDKNIHEIHKSLALVSQAYTLAPRNPKVRYAMAHLLATVGQYEESQMLYEKTMEEFPLNKETLVEKAKFLTEKNSDEAVKTIAEAIRLGTSVDSVADILLSCIRLKNDEASYSASLEATAEQFHSKLLYHKLGLAYLDEKKYLQSAAAFKRSIELGDSINSKLQLAIIQYEYLKDFKNSFLNFESLLAEIKQKETISNAAQSLVYSHYSLALYLNNRINEASRAAVQVALNSYEKNDYLKSLMYEYKSRGAITVLQPALELAISNDPTFDLAHAYLAEIYKQTKDYTKALYEMDAAIALNPDTPIYFYNKA